MSFYGHGILGSALATEFGIIVTTSNPERLKSKLYPAIKEALEYQCLSLITSPTNPTGEIWIVKRPKETRNDAEETHS